MSTKILVRSNFKLSHWFAVPAAFILSLFFATSALAVVDPLDNGEFGNTHGCYLTGWATNTMFGGSVTASNTPLVFGDGCEAKVYAYIAYPAQNSAQLSGSFVVPNAEAGGSQILHLNVWVDSSNGVSPGNATTFNNAQYIGVVGANNLQICGAYHNYKTTVTSAMGRFNCDLTQYQGQTVTLMARAMVDGRAVGISPSYSTLYVDNIGFGPTPRGAVTFNW